MKKKKLISLLLAVSLVGSMALTGCGSKKDDGGDTADNDLPTVTFTHGYYQDESEWAPAAEMRKIYEEFAEAHKDEFNFVIKADQGGAEGIYNTALNDLSAGEFYDIADFGGWDITEAAASAGAIMDLKPYLDADEDLKAGVGVCYDQNLTDDGKIYTVREQIEGVGFWYNQALFDQAGAKTPDQWTSWADFDEAVDKLVAAGISPFSLNAGWPTNILAAGYSQRDEASRAFYADGGSVKNFNIRPLSEPWNSSRLMYSRKLTRLISDLAGTMTTSIQKILSAEIPQCCLTAYGRREISRTAKQGSRISNRRYSRQMTGRRQGCSQADVDS